MSQYLFDSEVGKVGGWPVVVPCTPAAWNMWRTSQLVGWIVLLVQTIGPVLVVLSLWQVGLKSERLLSHTLTIFDSCRALRIISGIRSRRGTGFRRATSFARRVPCLPLGSLAKAESWAKDWCTIAMGVMFSFFVVVQLLNYAQSELAVLNLEDESQLVLSCSPLQ